MSEFVVVIPEDWTQMPAGIIDLIPSGIGTVTSWVESGTYYPLEEEMHANGLLPLNHHILEARIFNGDILVLRIAIE